MTEQRDTADTIATTYDEIQQILGRALLADHAELQAALQHEVVPAHQGQRTDPALAAAHDLRDRGDHVHLVSSAESRCLGDQCPVTSVPLG